MSDDKKRSIIARAEWKLYKTLKRAKNKNLNPTILSGNCTGGVILHDLGLPFNTPTINWGISPANYIKLLQDPKKYFNAEVIDTGEMFDNGYLANIADIRILFAHVKSFNEGLDNWNRRKARVNFDNLFVIMTDSNMIMEKFKYDDLLAFDALPYKNKVIFTHVPHPEIKSSYYIKGFEDKDEIVVLSKFKPTALIRRYIDDFDYVKFLNGGGFVSPCE